jgi:uncharacterized protein HemX
LISQGTAETVENRVSATERAEIIEAAADTFLSAFTTMMAAWAVLCVLCIGLVVFALRGGRTASR